MTEALTTLFENHEIRAIEQNGEVWFPLVDLAGAWGVQPNTLYQIIDRNEKKFSMMTSGVHVTCTDTVKGVNERGLYLMLGAINTDRLKDRNAAEAILRFQRWVPELIQKYRKGEIRQTLTHSELDIRQVLNTARLLANETGGDLAAFQKITLSKCGMSEWAPALDTVPALMHGEKGWLIPTQIAEKINDECITAREVNNFLYNAGYQYRNAGVWRLTDKGEMHGEEYTYESPSRHREIRIRWRESVMEASGLIRHPEQAALPGARV